MAKTWSWVSLDGPYAVRQPFTSHKGACQLSPSLDLTSTYDSFKIPLKRKAGSKRIDSGVSTRLTTSEANMEKPGPGNSSGKAEITQIAPSNGTLGRANAAKKQRNEPSSSKSTESLGMPVSLEEEKEPTEDSPENATVPKTPDLGRLPTPDLSDLECGSFCNYCNDDEGKDDLDIKKRRTRTLTSTYTQNQNNQQNVATC